MLDRSVIIKTVLFVHASNTGIFMSLLLQALEELTLHLDKCRYPSFSPPPYPLPPASRICCSILTLCNSKLLHLLTQGTPFGARRHGLTPLIWRTVRKKQPLQLHHLKNSIAPYISICINVKKLLLAQSVERNKLLLLRSF